MSRQAATNPHQYTLTIDEAAVRYEHAGHPRTIRTIQRYCAKGHLDCLRQETSFGDKYMITPESVARHIAQIAELASTTGRDMPRPAAIDVAREDGQELRSKDPPTSPDPPRPAAADDRYLAQLESENVFLKSQITSKDTQIAALLERDHETNALINGLQRMLGPLLGAPDAGRREGPPHQTEDQGRG
ncbi:hypothetical protein [Bradyrhizobium nitroreducens]|nr:hypothetical protein [Bradyrhizobium nitroreducens]